MRAQGHTTNSLPRTSIYLLGLSTLLLITGCDKHPWNSPYEHHWGSQHTLFSSFSEPPKTLDPAKSYASDSDLFIQQIVEIFLR